MSAGSQGPYESVADQALWPDDTVEYRLYPAQRHTHEYLNKLAVDCTHFSRLLLLGHVWNYGGFGLAPWKEGTSYPAHLFGRTCFHDNIEDEWLIVYLLLSLSKQMEGLVMSVQDGDGEFLLIEAAHCLPRWLKPETAINRVFIQNGLLHIIPKPRSPADVTRFPVAMPTIREAIRLVSDPLIDTVASDSIQEAIQSRIKRFSGSLEFLYHYAHCSLPLPAAHVMSHDPQLVSAAVHALCEREPLDNQACQKVADSTFSPLKHASVSVGIRFSKLLYARLLHQQFSAPRNAGFSIPPPGNPRHQACVLGMKLTYGLEILVKRVRCDPGEGVRCDGSDDVERNPHWSSFLTSLKEKGYFRGEIDGSKLYQQLVASAKEYFCNSSRSSMAGKDSDAVRDLSNDTGQRILHILRTVPYSEEEIRKKWAELEPCDDDSWLNLDSSDIDSVMQRSAGYPTRSQNTSSFDPSGRPSSAGSKVMSSADGELDLESLVFGMKSFVDKVSTHKGAEFPWTADEATAVNFDPDSFIDTIQHMLGQTAARQPRPSSDSEDTLSGDENDDDLSISSDESGTSEPGGVLGNEDTMVTQLMEEMDLELEQTEVGKSFQRAEVVENHTDEDVRPVNVDFNLVKNILDSHNFQGGGAGPASNILSSLGVHVPS